MDESSTRVLAIAEALKAFRSPDLWGYVMARLDVTACSAPEQSIHWRNDRMVVVRHPLGADQLSVLLMKPRFDTPEIPKREIEKGHGFFTEAQVDFYLQRTGDDNPIHRSPAALVPGLLLLSELERHFFSKSLQLFSVQFKSGLRVNEPFVVDLEKPEGIGVKKTDGTLILRVQL